jgi:GNAT superfamily N-acetyltransferase
MRPSQPDDEAVGAGGVQIRPLSDTDSLADLTLLLHRSYKRLLDMGLRYMATAQNAAETAGRIAGGRCFVAVLGDRMIGTVTYQRASTWDGSPWMRRPEVANVGQFAVEPELQRQGVGSLLLERAETIGREEGATEIALSTAEPATHLIHYYTKRGYRLIELTDATLPQGYRSVILSKRL